jgi:hypothetical protein
MLIALNLIILISIIYFLSPSNLYLVVFVLFLFALFLYQIFILFLPHKSAMICAFYIIALIAFRILGVLDLLNVAMLTALVFIAMAFFKMK